jgi:hypothetical protein
MGYFFGQGPPISPAVTRREYLDAVDRAFESLSHENRGIAYGNALENLVGGRPIRAAQLFSLLLERWPDDPTLHRMLGISYFGAGDARLAASHLEAALVLLARAITPGISLLRSLRIEFEAAVVRVALMAAYERIGHHAGLVRCLLAQNRLMAWDSQSRPRL